MPVASRTLRHGGDDVALQEAEVAGDCEQDNDLTDTPMTEDGGYSAAQLMGSNGTMTALDLCRTGHILPMFIRLTSFPLLGETISSLLSWELLVLERARSSPCYPNKTSKLAMVRNHVSLRHVFRKKVFY